MNGDVISSFDREIGLLTFGFRVENDAGVYPFAFQFNNNFNAFVVSTITLYSKFDSVHCAAGGSFVPAATTAEDCGAGVNDTDTPRGMLLNGTCLCTPPYFGVRCGSGCTGTRTLTVYGTDFTVTTSSFSLLSLSLSLSLSLALSFSIYLSIYQSIYLCVVVALVSCVVLSDLVVPLF